MTPPGRLRRWWFTHHRYTHFDILGFGFIASSASHGRWGLAALLVMLWMIIGAFGEQGVNDDG